MDLPSGARILDPTGERPGPHDETREVEPGPGAMTARFAAVETPVPEEERG